MTTGQENRFDFAVIGSGVSGGRIAYELTAGGARCVLLEAGAELGPGTFPAGEMDYSAQMFWGGGMEVSTDGRLCLLRARCLGGTSVVNQALLDRFDDLAWEDWRDRSGVAFLNGVEMAEQYDALERELPVSAIPERHYNRNARLFIETFEKRNFRWSPLRRAQRDCALDAGSDCMACLGGCRRESKQSALVTTIRWARARGLTVLSDFEVGRLDHHADRVVVDGLHGGAAARVVADRVVLAAGALGNTRILLRSGLASRLPALGTAFACHPQFFAYGLFDEPVDAHRGAFQAVKSDEPRLRRAGIKLESNFAPPIATALLLPGFGREHQAMMKRYRHLASLELAVRDEPAGRLRLGPNGRLLIDKPLTASDRRKCDEGLSLLRELLIGAGARQVIVCRQAFALHLMGGCSIGVDAQRSVVGPDFRVHGYPRLYAADSSIFPSAPGINPSFTIMALSRKAGQDILAGA
jgi:choline dehydrogenase-like flavoprotein